VTIGFRSCLGVLLAVLAVSCKPDPRADKPSPANPVPPTAVASTQAPPAASSEPVYHLSRAQTGLPRAKLLVGPREIQSEVCITLAQISTGLMFRESIGPEETMFFVFGEPHERSFYMKNVKFPIAAAYIDSEGIIQEVVQLKAFDVTPVPSKSNQIQYVLETAPDWFERNGVGVGAKVATAVGSLKEKLEPAAQLR
jgi:hypothetical protein